MNLNSHWCCVSLLLATIAVGPACRKQSPSADSSPPTVTVQLPKREPVTQYMDLTGTVAPSVTVDLVARVVGYLESVHFDDGAYVDKDQLLFIIEPKPYEEQLALSQAQLDQAQAEYDRQMELIKQNATSQASTEKWKSQRDQAAAQVELAKLNLSYTKVTAPFAGQIGRRLVDPGNLVGVGGATKLATLDQLHPIFVYFTLNETQLLQLRRAMVEQGLKPGSQIGKAPVQVALQDEPGFPHEGVLDFADNTVSTSTGTLQLRATFDNKDQALFPGLFVRVRIPLGQPSPMLVIPAHALGNDQEGDFVLVVDADDTVRRQSVKKGPSTAAGLAIRTGLSESDRVIVRGLQQARPGHPVKVQAPASGPATP